MPNTASGYPYPAQSDPVAQGATAIQNLANAIESKLGTMAAGQAVVPIPVVGTTYSLSITFPAGRFTAAPTAIFTLAQAVSTPQNSATGPASNPTANGFTIRAARVAGSAGDLNVGWLAVS